MTTTLLASDYRRIWWALVLRGLVGVALGVIILWRPLNSVAAFALFIALWALFSGIAEIVHAIDLRPQFDRWWVLLLSGLVSAVFGIAALYYYPGLSLAFAVIWTAWWLLSTGGLAIASAVVERRVGRHWGWTFTFGLLAIVCGVLAFLHPPVTLAALMGLIAGFALVGGVMLLIGAYRLSSLKREVRSVAGPAAAH